MKILKIFIVLALLAFTSYLVDRFWTQKQIVDVAEAPGEEVPVELCFAKFGEKDENGFYDRYTLYTKIDNKNGLVSGELKMIPKEKDSKTGPFSGTITQVDDYSMARTIDAIWDASAEGMTVKEELRIVFGEGMANIGTGEMVEGESGVYVYKNKDALFYGEPSLVDIYCADLKEIYGVESLLKENINTLSAKKPVLGGMWYVVNYDVNTTTKTGSVLYEDGHIQERANFSYEPGTNGEVKNLFFVYEGES